MKHYTFQSLQKLPFAEDAHVPAPFPGNWPTRMAWEVTVRFQKRDYELYEDYLGKPNQESLRGQANLLRQRYPNLTGIETHFWEFDRNHVILHQWFMVGHGWANKRSLLFSAYHPWENPGQALDHFRTKQYLKNIGGFRVYSAAPRLKLEYIQKYKLWMLNNCGKELKSRDDRLAERLERMKIRGRARA